MTLEEEKKPMNYHEEKIFVLKKLGYHCPNFSSSTTWWMPHEGEFDRHVAIDSYKWNPKFDRRCWDEIWGRMDEDIACRYIYNIRHFVQRPQGAACQKNMDIHKVKPEICWKALIKTIKE